METIAHRCFAGIAPENTVAAARTAAAVADGVPTVEIDVHPTADDRVAVFHDPRLDGAGHSRGLTDGSGYVWESTADELAALSVLGTDLGVPTLERVLAALPAGSRVVVELKSPGSDDLRPDELLDPAERERRRERWRPFVGRVVRAAADHELVLSSFCEGALAAATAVAPETPLAPIGRDDPAALWTVAERYDAAAIHPPFGHLRGPRFGDGPTGFDPDGDTPESAGAPDLVARAQESGRELNAWTARGWKAADHIRQADVDGVIADYPDLYRWQAVER